MNHTRNNSKIVSTTKTKISKSQQTPNCAVFRKTRSTQKPRTITSLQSKTQHSKLAKVKKLQILKKTNISKSQQTPKCSVFTKRKRVQPQNRKNYVPSNIQTKTQQFQDYQDKNNFKFWKKFFFIIFEEAKNASWEVFLLEDSCPRSSTFSGASRDSCLRLTRSTKKNLEIKT